MKVLVQSLNGETFSLNLKGSDTIGALKTEISKLK